MHHDHAAAANGPSASPESPPSDASEQPANDIPSGSKTVPSVNGAGGNNVGAGYNVAAVLILSSIALSLASGF